jgi:ATP-dependent helicase HrpA
MGEMPGWQSGGGSVLSNLEARLARCMFVDQRALRRRARGLDRQARPGDGRWNRLDHELSRCEAVFDRRRAGVPAVSIPEHLPIAAHADEVVAALRGNQVLIVSGDTGCGKSTQLPKLCLRAGRGVAGQIAHTQPRRVAARGIARRLSEEMAERLGDSVGYKVRFDAQVRRESYIKVVTDGVLLAELARDRELGAYDTIIVDEAHERSLNIDVLLGHLKHLLRRRADLHLVISSATLEESRFARFFDDAPVIRVQGRSYPVELRYRPVDPQQELPQALQAAVMELQQAGSGDVLVFLSGEREIAESAAHLRRGLGHRFEVLTLYARLPVGQQDRVFEPHDTPRIILATNVAETSLTVPGVRYVVDAGHERVARRTPGSAVQRLPVERISRASARQRAGRCGREQPGICIRLYDEAIFESMADFPQPEILRTELAAVLLRIRALGLRRVAAFHFIDAPDRRHVNDGLRLLRELGALDARDDLTPIGRQLARFPVDPRIGRMLLTAGELDCVKEVLVIAAGLAVGDPRDREPGRRGLLPQHRRFEDPHSDFARFLKIWQHLREAGGSGRLRELGKLCRRRRLSFPRVQEWRELHLQLSLIARDMGLHPRTAAASPARIHRALLSGLLRNVGTRVGERDYQGIRGNAFRISRASGQFDARPRWVLAAEFIDAGQTYAHCVARIRPQWVERAAGELLRRTHFDAWWDPDRGEAMVHEQTALYSQVVTHSRRVRFAPVSREGAREVFIRGALVDGRLHGEAPVVSANRDFLAGRRRRAQRLREPDPVLSDERLFEYFDQALPPDLCDAAGFERWCRDAPPEALQRLSLERHMPPPPGGEASLRAYPESWHVGGDRYPLRYRFCPGEEEDGITLRLPRRSLSTLDPRRFDWVVPGLLPDKVRALLRALPKAMRRRLGSTADVAASFIAAHTGDHGSLREALAGFLALRHGIDVDIELWSDERLRSRLPVHLMMRFQVVDDAGEEVAVSRDLGQLQTRHSGGHGARDAAPAQQPAAVTLAEWPETPLADCVREQRSGMDYSVYPALQDCGRGVALVHAADVDAARAVHRGGVLRLLRLRPELARLRLDRAVPAAAQVQLLHALLPPAPAGPPVGQDAPPGVLESVLERALLRCCCDDDAWSLRSRDDFARACARLEQGLAPALATVSEEVVALLESQRQLASCLLQDWPQAWADNLADAREQLDWLVHQGFLASTPSQALERMPRYLEGLRLRLDKLAQGGARDGDKLRRLRPLWSRFLARDQAHRTRGRRDPALSRYRWLMEEYRISVFAQELRTREKVSERRLDQLWALIPP